MHIPDGTDEGGIDALDYMVACHRDRTFAASSAAAGAMLAGAPAAASGLGASGAPAAAGAGSGLPAAAAADAPTSGEAAASFALGAALAALMVPSQMRSPPWSTWWTHTGEFKNCGHKEWQGRSVSTWVSMYDWSTQREVNLWT